MAVGDNNYNNEHSKGFRRGYNSEAAMSTAGGSTTGRRRTEGELRTMNRERRGHRARNHYRAERDTGRGARRRPGDNGRRHLEVVRWYQGALDWGFAFGRY